jgi:hypothetical protein
VLTCTVTVDPVSTSSTPPARSTNQASSSTTAAAAAISAPAAPVNGVMCVFPAGGQPRNSLAADTRHPANAGSACLANAAPTAPVEPSPPQLLLLLLLLLLLGSYCSHSAMLTNACELTCLQDSL